MTAILALAELNISPKIQWSQLKTLACAEQQSRGHNLFHSHRRVPQFLHVQNGIVPKITTIVLKPTVVEKFQITCMQK